MFDIHSIKIENFKSYRGKHKFVFPTAPGLYFITGNNKLEPRLESNGAGKSTFLDAIYWCLYGKTLRGLKASDVITWGEKNCAVTVILTVADTQATITRKQNPNSLELGGRLVDQETVTKYIGLGEDSFTYSVIMPQFGQAFFELTPTNKLAIFSQIMKLDRWLDCSQKATVKAAVLETTIKQLEQRAASLTANIDALADEMAGLVDKETSFHDERKKILNQIEREIDEAEVNILDLQSTVKKAEKDLKTHVEQRKKKTSQLTTIQAAHEKHRENRYASNTVCSNIKVKLDTIYATYSKLKGIDSTCPTCLQAVDQRHLIKERKRLESDEKKLRQENAEAKTKFDESDRFVKKTLEDLTAIARAVSSLDADCTAAQVTSATAEAEIKLEKAKIARLKRDLVTEEKQPNPYTDIINLKTKQAADYSAKLTQHLEDAGQASIDHEAVSFWVGGFKRVRLFLIEETLRAFELEVNSSLANLGLTDWKVEFDVERENKSGGLTKGFAVFVTNSSHPEPVRFEAWSGGEAQRLQLAGDLGLANLIMLQAGLRNTIEFYDEPSRHLSRAGLLDLAETLHQRAITDQKRIMLIDHQTIEFGEFADIIKIVKTENGSEIQK